MANPAISYARLRARWSEDCSLGFDALLGAGTPMAETAADASRMLLASAGRLEVADAKIRKMPEAPACADPPVRAPFSPGDSRSGGADALPGIVMDLDLAISKAAANASSGGAQAMPAVPPR
jgi:hypothetical protein